MEEELQKNFDLILETLKESTNELQKNLELKYTVIEDFRLGEFDDVLDLRTKEEFDNDHIVGSNNFPCLTIDKFETLPTIDQTTHRVTMISHIWYLFILNTNISLLDNLVLPWAQSYRMFWRENQENVKFCLSVEMVELYQKQLQVPTM